MTTTSPGPLIAFRFIEGIGAGLFTPAALSLLNALPDHQTGSGYFMSFLNFGLVAGLIGGGLLVEGTGMLLSGIVFFTILSVVPSVASLFMRQGARPPVPGESARDAGRRLVRQRMSDVLATLQDGQFHDFASLFDPKEGRLGVVVTFLAILDLVKESLLELVQAEAYSPIHVRAGRGEALAVEAAPE